MSIYFTSDLHLGHDKPFLYEPRGFNSIKEHDESIANNWNSIVSNEDTVYILGDLILNDNDNGIRLIKKLKGKKIIILGNHDTSKRIELYQNELGMEGIKYSDIIKYDKYHFYISHYPTLVGNNGTSVQLKSRLINLCGHTHTKDPFNDWDKGLIYHVELDAHNNYPILIDDIISECKEKYKATKIQ